MAEETTAWRLRRGAASIRQVPATRAAPSISTTPQRSGHGSGLPPGFAHHSAPGRQGSVAQARPDQHGRPPATGPGDLAGSVAEDCDAQHGVRAIFWRHTAAI